MDEYELVLSFMYYSKQLHHSFDIILEFVAVKEVRVIKSIVLLSTHCGHLYYQMCHKQAPSSKECCFIKYALPGISSPDVSQANPE